MVDSVRVFLDAKHTGPKPTGIGVRDPAEIARQAERILTSPTLAAKLRGRGFERAALCSWERGAAETVEVYRSLI